MSRGKSNMVLLIVAAIWGFAFVAQRVGMEYIGPFAYNGVRFALGSISLLPLILFNDRKADKTSEKSTDWLDAMKAGFLVGLVLFTAASLQQIGLVYTEAGKAAFITGLYIVIVPFVGFFVLKHNLSRATMIGSMIAAIGLYLLSVKADFNISYGDLLELIGAIFWSVHILIIDWFAKKVNVLKLAMFQFVFCSILSLLTASVIETVTIDIIYQAAAPILYGGLFSVGIAYTLQIVGQKYAQPSHAAIIMSMETVFAAIGGFLLLNERLTTPELFGCLLMFSGMVLSQHHSD